MSEGAAYQQVSSGGSLTRFRPKPNADARSANTLKLIKKDGKQIPRVKAIEDHCQLIHDNNSTYITRLYVDVDICAERGIPEKLRQKLLGQG